MKLGEILKRKGKGVAVAKKYFPNIKVGCLDCFSSEEKFVIILTGGYTAILANSESEDYTEWCEEITPLKEKENFNCIENILCLEVLGDDEIKFVDANVLEKRLVEWLACLKNNLKNLELPK